MGSHCRGRSGRSGPAAVGSRRRRPDHGDAGRIAASRAGRGAPRATTGAAVRSPVVRTGPRDRPKGPAIPAPPPDDERDDAPGPDVDPGGPGAPDDAPAPAGPATPDGPADATPGATPGEDSWEPADAVWEPEVAPAAPPADRPIVGTGTPPVVAVVVTHDPGPWFAETLRSLERQDYGQLSVLVVDNASAEDPAPLVADVYPSAYVKRLEADEGFSAAADEAIGAVEGAPFLLFLHDDVRLADNAVTTMVTEAFRANAGVVGPKLVDWDRPEVLRSAGLAVDVHGAASELVDAGELDQGQHDITRPVFAVSSACVLVRTDLFRSLGGFSADLPFFGEDVDLCWRAHLAGATVQYCPRAVVAHRGRFDERRPVEDAERYRLRHQGRMVLANTSGRRLLRVVPTLAVLLLVDLVGSVLVGRFSRAGDTVAATAWTLWSTPRILAARRGNRQVRRVPDSAFEQLFHTGSYRLRTLWRNPAGENRLSAATRTGRDYVRGLTTTSSRAAAVLLGLGITVAVLGGRGLVTGPVTSLRELITPGTDPGGLVAQWWTGWRPVGLGEASVPPALHPVAGAVAWLLGGATGLVTRLLTVVPLLAGALGAWKLLARTGSGRGRTAAFVVYALSPVALNAVAQGRLQALVAYAAAPWLLRRVAAHAGVEPFADRRAPRPPLLRHLAGDALLLGAVAAVSPLAAVLVAASVAVLGLGAAAGRQLGGVGMAARSVGGLLLSVPLWSPWLVAAAREGDLASLTGVWATRSPLPGAAEVITGDIGPVRPGVLGWGLLVAALVPLLTGRSWRFGWALGGWVLSFASWGAAILLVRADLVGGAGVALFVVPAVLGTALAVAMGPLAFEEDVATSDFGLGQLVSGIGLLALVVSLVPVAVASSNGRWYQPEGDYQRALRIVEEGEGFRTVWLGDPDVLPVAGWELEDPGGLAVAVTEGLEPTLATRARLDGGRGVAELRRVVSDALEGRTTRLGSLLAPMGVRYVIVVDRAAPQPFARLQVPAPIGVEASLEEQLDLERLPLSEGAALFRTSATWPQRADVAGSDLPVRGGAGADAALAAAPQPPAVLRRGGGTSFRGQVGDGAVVAQSVTADPGWRLEVDGRSARRSLLLGWSQRFAVEASGPAELTWRTPASTRGLQALQLVSLVAMLVVVGRRRRLVPVAARRQARAADAEPVVVVHDDSAGAQVPSGGPEAAGRSGGSARGGSPRRGRRT